MMWFPRFFTRTHVVLLVLLLGVTLLGFVLVPLGESLPIHWGFSGSADAFAPAPAALLFPLFITLVLASVIGLFFYAKLTRADFERGRSVINAAFAALEVIALVLLAGTILIGMGQEVDMVRLIVLGVLGMFALIGNHLPKSQPNRLAGLRLPTTLADAGNWRVTHIWTGRLMLALSLIGIVIALFGPPIWVMIVLVVSAGIVPMLAGTGISLSMAKRAGKAG